MVGGVRRGRYAQRGFIVLKVSENRVGRLRVKGSRYFDLTKIKEVGPDAVFVFFAGPPATALVKQFSEFGLKSSMRLTGAGWLISPLNRYPTV